MTNWGDGDALTPTNMALRASISSANAPTAGDSAGTQGTIKWGVISSTTYIFVCTSTDSWNRVATEPF